MEGAGLPGGLQCYRNNMISVNQMGRFKQIKNKDLTAAWLCCTVLHKQLKCFKKQLKTLCIAFAIKLFIRSPKHGAALLLSQH